MIYVLHGEEQYLLKKELQRIIDQNVTFEKEMNTSVFDASKTPMEEIIADAQTIPFFSDKKVVVVNHANFLSSSNDTQSNLEVFEHYLDKPCDTTILILICEHEKLDSRKKIVKRIQKEAKVLKFSLFNDFERSQFVKKECEKREMHFAREALQEFYFRAGYSPARILNELDKLSLYSKTIEKEDVCALVVRPLEDNVFDLFTMLVKKKFKKAYQYWKDFENQNIDPIAIIAMLASQYRFLHLVSMLRISGYTKVEIAKQLNAHSYRVEKTMEMCSLISEKEIAAALNDLAGLDQQMKAGKLDKKLGLELFLIEKGK